MCRAFQVLVVEHPLIYLMIDDLPSLLRMFCVNCSVTLVTSCLILHCQILLDNSSLTTVDASIGHSASARESGTSG